MEDQLSENFQSDNLSERAKAGNFEEENEGFRVTGQPSKRRKIDLEVWKSRCYVWEHFDVLEDEKGKLQAHCKYCETTNYRVQGWWGTTRCRMHLTTCEAYKASVAKNSLHDKCATKAKTPAFAGEFDQEVYTNMYADAIVSHGYSLSMVEDKYTRKLLEYLNPKVKAISRDTISKKVDALAATQDVAADGGNVDGDYDSDAESSECNSI